MALATNSGAQEQRDSMAAMIALADRGADRVDAVMGSDLERLQVWLAFFIVALAAAASWYFGTRMLADWQLR